MTRLASLCAGVLEVANAIAVRLEDVVGEWVDNLGTRPPARTREREALALLARWNDDHLIKWRGNSHDGGWVLSGSRERIEELIRDTGKYLDATAGRRR